MLAELFGAAAGSDAEAEEMLEQLEFTVSGDQPTSAPRTGSTPNGD